MTLVTIDVPVTASTDWLTAIVMIAKHVDGPHELPALEEHACEVAAEFFEHGDFSQAATAAYLADVIHFIRTRESFDRADLRFVTLDP